MGRRAEVAQLLPARVHRTGSGRAILYAMHLPPHLASAIEATHVAFEGLSHPLRIVSVDHTESSAGRTIEITVATSHEGRTIHAARRFGSDDLADEKQVTATLADAVRAELGPR